MQKYTSATAMILAGRQLNGIFGTQIGESVEEKQLLGGFRLLVRANGLYLENDNADIHLASRYGKSNAVGAPRVFDRASRIVVASLKPDPIPQPEHSNPKGKRQHELWDIEATQGKFKFTRSDGSVVDDTKTAAFGKGTTSSAPLSHVAVTPHLSSPTMQREGTMHSGGWGVLDPKESDYDAIPADRPTATPIVAPTLSSVRCFLDPELLRESLPTNATETRAAVFKVYTRLETQLSNGLRDGLRDGQTAASQIEDWLSRQENYQLAAPIAMEVAFNEGATAADTKSMVTKIAQAIGVTLRHDKSKVLSYLAHDTVGALKLFRSKEFFGRIATCAHAISTWIIQSLRNVPSQDASISELMEWRLTVSDLFPSSLLPQAPTVQPSHVTPGAADYVSMDDTDPRQTSARLTVSAPSTPTGRDLHRKSSRWRFNVQFHEDQFYRTPSSRSWQSTNSLC
eukprot:Polyplicarium_translucidae@DN4799_c0_g1_i1.p1